MSHQDQGTYGSKRQSWSSANPRERLQKIMTRYPFESYEEIERRFFDDVIDEPALIEVIIKYWCANNYHSLKAAKRTPRDAAATKAPTAATVEQIKENLKARIREEAQIMLLDMALPNGKTLRDSTFGYCTRLGGGLSRIGAKGKPGQIVGKHLSETEVRKLYGSAPV